MPMRRILQPTFFALLAACALGGFAPARAANILIVAGADGLAQSAATVMNTELTAGGNTVTVVNTGVPAGSLAAYTQIYDVRYSNNPAFSAGEQAQYVTFLSGALGNALFLMGENTGFGARNTPISAFVALVGGGSVPVPVTNNSGIESVNAPFNTTPNAISTVGFQACGKTTAAGHGGFASSEVGGGCALFFTQQTMTNAAGGALVVVYDINFVTNAGGGVNETAFRQNLEQFMALGGVTTVPTLGWWAQLFLALALCSIGVVIIRRRSRAMA
jgi:hypothetical protein